MAQARQHLEVRPKADPPTVNEVCLVDNNRAEKAATRCLAKWLAQGGANGLG